MWCEWRPSLCMNENRRTLLSATGVCRNVIADLAACNIFPTVDQILKVTHAHIGSRSTTPAQVRTQIVVAITANYFRLYAPDDGWSFEGLEFSSCTTDGGLMWTHADGPVLIDVVLIDHRPGPSALKSTASLLRDRVTVEYGTNATLRVLVPRSPGLSGNFPPDTPAALMKRNDTSTVAQQPSGCSIPTCT